MLGVGMSQEKIQELLYAMHQTRVEVATSDEDHTEYASSSLDSRWPNNQDEQPFGEDDLG